MDNTRVKLAYEEEEASRGMVGKTGQATSNSEREASGRVNHQIVRDVSRGVREFDERKRQLV